MSSPPLYSPRLMENCGDISFLWLWFRTNDLLFMQVNCTTKLSCLPAHVWSNIFNNVRYILYKFNFQFVNSGRSSTLLAFTMKVCLLGCCTHLVDNLLFHLFVVLPNRKKNFHVFVFELLKDFIFISHITPSILFIKLSRDLFDLKRMFVLEKNNCWCLSSFTFSIKY